MRSIVLLALTLCQLAAGWHYFRGSYRPRSFALAVPAPAPAGPAPVAPMAPRAAGPAPSVLAPPTQGVSLQSQNRAGCNQPAVGATATAPRAAATAPVAPAPMAAAPLAPRFMFPIVAGAAPAPVPMAAAPMAAAPAAAAPMAAGNACVLTQASTSPPENATGKYVAIGIGSLFGLITIAAIVQKYKLMGSYSSFWGRMVALASGAAAGGYGYMNMSSHSANSCDNLFGEGDCPCLACCYVLFAYGAFQLIFNLPYLYASEKAISTMYAKFGLFNQAAVEFAVSGGAAAGIKFMSGGIVEMVIAACGCLTGVLFFLGYFKGEDGALGRLFQSAKDMLDNAATAAAAMVDDGLKVFGLNADERNKVTIKNVYNFCRVVRGPDWSAGDDDGGPDGPGGEITGYIGENGVAEGVAVTAGQPGWAKVKWDPKIPGQPGKTGEYRIGAGNKFELKMAEETEGIVDKLMGQTFAMFGYDPSTSKGPPKEKKQIEFILSSKLPGEEESEKEPELNNDSADEDTPSPKNQEKAIKAAQAAQDAVHKEMLFMACDVYDKSGKSTGRCDDTKQMLFKSAVRHRDLGNKQDAIVVELQKIPEDVAVLALNVKIPEGKQLGAFGSMSIRATSQGKDLSKLSVPPAEGLQSIKKHMGSRGYLWFLLYQPEPGKWFAERAAASLGSDQIPESLADKVGKFLADREPKPPKSKKKLAEYEAGLVGGKSVDGLISVEEIFDYLKVEIKCEAQAREMMNAKLNAVTEAYTTRLKAQGVPAPQAALQAKKLALLQINKQHQMVYQKTLIVQRANYIKQRMHPVHAMMLAKKDANRAALYDGKEAEIRRAVMQTIKEEKEAAEEAKRQQDAEFADTYTGKASAIAGSLWGWASSGDTSEKPKKKKKKKKDAEEEPAEPPAAAPAAAPALPPQFANLNPQQIAALRAMQQKQLAAKQAAAPQ